MSTMLDTINNDFVFLESLKEIDYNLVVKKQSVIYDYKNYSLYLGLFHNLEYLLFMAIQRNNTTVIDTILDCLSVPNEQMSVKERLAYYELFYDNGEVYV